MFCDGLLLDVRTSAVTKKYWRRSAACCLVKTTAHRIACRKLFVAAIEISGSQSKLQISPRPPAGFACWCCIFFLSLPRRRAGPAIGLGYYQGARPPPSGPFRGNGPEAGGRQSGLAKGKGQKANTRRSNGTT